jgi:hypothetical protein
MALGISIPGASGASCPGPILAAARIGGVSRRGSIRPLFELRAGRRQLTLLGSESVLDEKYFAYIFNLEQKLWQNI